MTHEPNWSPDMTGPTSDLTCADCQSRLPDYLAGALTPAWRASLARHLATCAACRDEQRQWQAVQQALRQQAAPTEPADAEVVSVVTGAWARLVATVSPQGDAPAAAEMSSLVSRQALAWRPRTSIEITLDAADAPAPIERTGRGHTHESRRHAMRDTTQASTGAEASVTSAPTITVARRPHGMSVWLSGLTAALIVALLVGVLFAFPALRHATGKGGSPQGGHVTHQIAPVNYPQRSSCSASAITANLPAHVYLRDVAMVSPDEGWAVGATRDRQDAGPATALILHYQHCHWAAQGPEIPYTDLDSVSVVSPTQVWAVGGLAGGPKLAMYYNGASWIVVPLPDFSSPYGAYAQITMLSADEGWLVEVTPGQNGQGRLANKLFHYQRGVWTAVALPTQLSLISDVAPVARDDAWAVGYVSDANQQPEFARYLDGRWTVSVAPANTMPGQLRMFSPTDGWALDGAPTPGTNAAVGVLRYDGTSWRAVHMAVNPATQQIEVMGDNEIWAFDFSGGSAQLYDGRAWRQVRWPDTNIYGLSSMSRAAVGEYWAVGEYETTVTQPNGNQAGTGHTVLLHYLNGAWTEYK